MSVTRIWNPDSYRPLHVVMIVLLIVALAGSFMLLSVAEPTTLVDGAREWSVNSPLRSVVRILCLDYAFPTFYADSVKSFVMAIAAALSVLAVAVAIWLGEAPGEGRSEDDVVATEVAAGDSAEAAEAKRHIPPLLAAQLLAGLFVLWSMLSATWSGAAELAYGGTILVAIQFLWAFSLGNTLNRIAAREAALAMLVVSAVTATVAVWYYYGRNDTLRAKFPFGNPIFLATCLLPALLVAASVLAGQVRTLLSGGGEFSVPRVAISLVALVLGGWAFALSNSRGPQLGLVYGVLVILFWNLPVGRRWPSVLGMVVVALVAYRLATGGAAADVATGRDATMRVRGYAWSYALELFEQRPLIGHGQGGFARIGDSLASITREKENLLAQSDVVLDPRALSDRLDHAHNEWLELLADLGAVGMVLFGCVIIMTFLSVSAALDAAMRPSYRNVLIGLVAALVAIGVADFFSVGLRLGAVPVAFYTVLGLIWALSRSPETDVLSLVAARSALRRVLPVVCVVIALAVAIRARTDFSAARNAYTAYEHVRNGRFGEAVAALNRPQRQLNPARELRNRLRLAEAYMLWARSLKDECFGLLRAATASGQAPDPGDPRVIKAEQKRDESIDYVNAGRAVIDEVLAWSPHPMDAGLIDYWLNRIEIEFAMASTQPDAAAPVADRMFAAIEAELGRQPYSLELALEYVRASGPRLDPGTAALVLARPLRIQPAPGPLVSLVAQIASAEDFDARFTPVFSGAIAAAEADTPPPPAADLDLFVPEILRLAAIVQVTRGGYEMAERALALAAARYRGLDAPSATPMGLAGCYYEWAQARFLLNPDDADAAIATLKLAIEAAPDSEIGRAFKRDQREVSLVMFQLAGGQEEQARRVIVEAAGAHVEAARIDRYVASVYADLCVRLISREKGSPPARYGEWVRRCLELDPEGEKPNRVAADWALRQGDLAAMVAHLRKALAAGAPVESVTRFVALAREQHPLFRPLDELYRELAPDAATSPDTQPQPAPGPSSDPSAQDDDAAADRSEAPVNTPAPDATREGLPEPPPQGNDNASGSTDAPAPEPGAIGGKSNGGG